ncbi:MAG: N-acetyltransferase, partial [Beijerinckiaceae bacterium]|nr:N-acetyltransferase [Beijerinckiaceae bacterium]
IGRPTVASASATKPPRSGVVRRAAAALTTPLLRDSSRRRVEKPTAPRPEKRPAARKPPFRPHALGVRDAHATDRPQIETLLTAAFGRTNEARVFQALQDNGDIVCALVAEYESEIIGIIAFSRVDAQIGGRPIKSAALASLAVAQNRQGRGVGAVLVSSGLEAAGAAGFEAIIVPENGAYFERFGFSAAAAEGFESGFAGALLGLELKSGALAGAKGTLVFPAALAPSTDR